MQYPLVLRSQWRMHQRYEKIKCPDIWIRLPKHKWPKSWYNLEDPVIHLETHVYGHFLEGLLWEREWLGKSTGLVMLIYQPGKRTPFLYMWKISKWQDRKYQTDLENFNERR